VHTISVCLCIKYFIKLNQTHLEMAYKNIRKRIQRLQILRLIQEIETDKDPEH